MFNKCSLGCRKAPTMVVLQLINNFWEHLPSSFWSLNKKTYSKQIACQEDECSSGACDCRFLSYIGRFPRGLLMHRHTRACTRTTVANYRKHVMRFLMLPLPLIHCYINYNFLQTGFLWCQHQVSMATASGSQIPGIRIHTLENCAAQIRQNLNKQTCIKHVWTEFKEVVTKSRPWTRRTDCKGLLLLTANIAPR